MTLVALGIGAGLSLVLLRSARVGPARRRSIRLRPERDGWLPPAVRAVVARRLEACDLGVTPDDAVTVVLGAGATSIVVVGGLAPALVPVALAAAVVTGPLALASLRRRAAVRFVAALPALVDDVVGQLHAGGTVAEALVAAGEHPGPLHADLVRLQTRLRLGSDLTGALEQWTRDRGIPELRIVAGGLALVAASGGPSAEALDGLARSVRDQLGAQADAAALAAQARMSAVVVGAAPVGYLVFASCVDSDAAGALVGSATGRTCLVVGLLLEGLGVVWMRRIIRSQP